MIYIIVYKYWILSRLIDCILFIIMYIVYIKITKGMITISFVMLFNLIIMFSFLSGMFFVLFLLAIYYKRALNTIMVGVFLATFLSISITLVHYLRLLAEYA